MPAIEILNEEAEVVDRKLVTVELAEQLWPNRWRFAEW